MNREELIIKHMTHVAVKVSEFIKCFPMYAYLRDDLISEGYVGLIEGIDKFDPSVGSTLKSYITHWILLRVSEFANNSHIIPIPSRTASRHKELTPPTVAQIDTEELDKIISKSNPKEYMEVYENIISHCATDEERAIVQMRERGSRDPEIAATLGLAIVTVYMLRREIYARYLADNKHLRGEA